MSSSSASATVAVDKATSDLLLGPDWTTNMEICDSVNSLHWQAKDVVKAVKKRLQHKSPRVQLLSLTLLETLVKNCGDYLHHQVAEKNLLGEMVKIVKKKADMQVRDKILVMVDSWQQAFGGPEGKYPQYYWAYDELRRSGVEFPRRSPDASPILTPPVSHPPLRQPQGGYGVPQAGYVVPQAGYGMPQAGYGVPQAGYGIPQAGYGVPQAGYGIPQVGYGMPSGSSRRLDEAMATEVEGLSLSSIESMRDVMDLLGDMLQAVNPSDREAVKDEVIVDLVERCRSNQKKLMQMLTSTGDDELLGRGLDLNDSLQSILAKHDAIASGSPLPAQALKPAESSPKSSEVKDSSSVAGSSSPLPATVSMGKSPIEEEYEEEEDEFAQLARRHSKPSASVTKDPTSSESHIAEKNPLALALPDPPPPLNTTKEQDMIDLLSITLSTPSTLPPPSSQPSPPPPPVSKKIERFFGKRWRSSKNSMINARKIEVTNSENPENWTKDPSYVPITNSPGVDRLMWFNFYWKEMRKKMKSQSYKPMQHESKFGANPESSSSNAKTNADLLDRNFTNSPMDGKVKPPNIQVFVNFRGDQLRNNFVGHLVEALKRNEINVFIDDHEQRGEDLNSLLKRIEDSGIAIVVFSIRYTESTWCLEELVKIKERVQEGRLKVLPIFFKVTPENVKRLQGEFGDNFRDNEYMHPSDKPKIERWREAIKFVSQKFALTFDEKSASEIEFIEDIVKHVLKLLQAISTVESGKSSRQPLP